MVRGIKNFFHSINSLLACLYYRYPGRKMTVVAVTGTDGKTTTTHLLYHILHQAGEKVSMISTIEARIGDEKFNTGFHVTTPSPWQLQEYIKKALNAGSKYFILETTSHALDQHRIDGSYVDIGLMTNISHEHLDYHKTFKNYLLAKVKIFSKVKYSILNKDDISFLKQKKFAEGKTVTYAIKNKADYTLRKTGITVTMPGKYNIYNSLSAYTVAAVIGIEKKKILGAISSFQGLPGRIEEVKTGKDYKIFIDFAHKPNALKQVLLTVRKFTSGRIIAVFGCAGLRDRMKRPMMGEIAVRFADDIILTAEDPRTEDVRQIIAEIAIGCRKMQAIEVNKKDKNMLLRRSNKKYYWRIPDRQEAINFAIRHLAQKGDLVIFLGKGHEKSMCYGKTEYSWDEKEAISKALYGSVNTSATVH